MDPREALSIALVIAPSMRFSNWLQDNLGSPKDTVPKVTAALDEAG